MLKMQCVNITSSEIVVPICTSHQDKMLRTLVRKEMLKDVYGLKHVRGNGIALDIGAHVGTAAILLSLMNPKIKIYSFEPSPVNFEYLAYNVKNFGLQNRIKIFNNAVSMYDETLEFEHSPDDTTSSKAVRLGKTFGRLPKTISRIKTFPIMNFLDRQEKVSFVKLDCEGCEVDLIPMINKLFRKNPECHFAGEFHEWHLRITSNISRNTIKATHRAMCQFSNRYVERLRCVKSKHVT